MLRDVFALVAVVMSVPSLAGAANVTTNQPPPGATSCSGCHAPTGSGGFKPINGHDAAELSARMEAFRSGERPSTVMGRLMKGFSRDEIQALAAWTAAQK
jgi:sulfide dehydrogenase cytochrome subunit